MGKTLVESPAGAVSTVDFRRPSRVGRDALLVVESAHDVLVRRLTTAWGNAAHAAIEIEHVATDQTSVDDYVRALPSPSLVAQLRVDRLGATALMEVDLPLALLLMERILGGAGDATVSAVARQPSELETGLISRELITPALPAIDEVLHDVDGEPTSVLAVETNPQRVQMSSSSELLLLLTYRVEIRGELPAQGLVTIAYPVTPLMAHVERFLAGSSEDDLDPVTAAANRAALSEMEVDVQVELGGTSLHAGMLAALAVGDVLRLDHHVDRPARLAIGDRSVGSAHLGRRGRKLAVQVVGSPASTI